MKDLILGYSSGYTWTQLKYWVNSITKINFTGDKVILAGDMLKDDITHLKDRGFLVVSEHIDSDGNSRYMGGNIAPVVYRFYMANLYLRQSFQNYNWVFWNDVKDVIYQVNPSDFINGIKRHKTKIIAGSEQIIYKDESWGWENIRNSYPIPSLIEDIQGQQILNAGTFSGSPEYLKDLFLQIFMLSLNNRVHNPDQAAFNILMRTLPYSDIMRDDIPDYALQCGTTFDMKYRNKSDFVKYIIRYDDKVTYNYSPFCIVHQWDRECGWIKEHILKEYGND